MRPAALLLATALLPAAAAYTGAAWEPRREPPFAVAPSVADACFTAEAPPRFTVTPREKAAALRWTLHRQGIARACAEGRAEAEADGGFRIAPPSDRLRPGFYLLRLAAEGGAAQGQAGFGWRIAEQRVASPCPDDYDAFWAARRAALAQVPPDVRRDADEQTIAGDAIGRYNLEKAWQPAHPDPEGERHQEVVVGRLSFASVGGVRIHAWFARPKAPGPFPGVLVLPGAGNRWRPMPLEHARHGFAALDIQVHGEPVDQPNERYAKLPREDAGDPDKLIHTAIYLHALRALDVLAGLPGVDAARLAVDGSSQGGRLALVVAAWDPRVRAGVGQITHFAARSYGAWAKAENTAKRDGLDGDPGADAEVPRGERYLDVLHLAPQVRCPFFLTAGLIDDVSPPATIHAVFQTLPNPDKVFHAVPGLSHEPDVASDRLAWRFLEQRLGPGR